LVVSAAGIDAKGMIHSEPMVMRQGSVFIILPCTPSCGKA
jgi:hypothetical protein